MKDAQIKKGTKVQVNGRHAGCSGCTGRVTSGTPLVYRGRKYWNVSFSGGRHAGDSMRFLASELNQND